MTVIGNKVADDANVTPGTRIALHEVPAHVCQLATNEFLLGPLRTDPILGQRHLDQGHPIAPTLRATGDTVMTVMPSTAPASDKIPAKNGKDRAMSAPTDVQPKPAATNAAAGAEKSAKPGAGSASKARSDGQARFAQTFSQAVAVMMRSPGIQNLTLANLEWLLLPPMMLGQCRIAHSQATAGQGYLPIAMAVWARVSPDVDKRLSSNLDQPLQLKPAEWSTGDILWLIAVAGQPDAIPSFLEKLSKTDFAGKTVKMRVAGPDGKVVIKELGKR